MYRKTLSHSCSCAKRLDCIYWVPINGPYDARYFHADIAEMNEAQIRRELERARLRLLQDKRPSHWLLERFDFLIESLKADAN